MMKKSVFLGDVGVVVRKMRVMPGFAAVALKRRTIAFSGHVCIALATAKRHYSERAEGSLKSLQQVTIDWFVF